MKIKCLKILFSCAGGEFIIQNIIAIKSIKKFTCKVYGVDQKSISRNNYEFLDRFDICPNSSIHKIKYKKFILDYCNKNKIDLFFPFSENEIDILSKLDLTKIKTKFVLPAKSFLNITSDKYLFFKYLKDNNIYHDPFYKIDSKAELKALGKNKNFNSKSYVLKPRISSGSRGVLIFDDNQIYSEPLEDRLCAIGPKRLIHKYIKKNNITLENYILTKYYGNNILDVDSYSRKGKLIYLLMRQRQYVNPLSPINEGFEIVNNKKIKELVSKVAKNLNLDGILDLDIALDSNGDPKIIDVSARLSGSAGSGMIAGMNIFEVILNNYFSTTNEVNMKPKKIMIRPIKIFYELKK